MDEPVTYTLRLTFDARQIVDDLQFDILKEGVSAQEMSGELAGAYCMSRGDELNIEVAALHEAGLVSEVILVDLTLVCRPGGGVEQPDLSPYDSDSAGYTIRDWIAGDCSPPKDGVQIQPFTLDQTFEMNATGRWQVAGYLSAKIRSATGIAPVCRVYLFDPIVVVRGGGGVGV